MDRSGRGMVVSPPWARANVPGLASSSIHTAEDMVKMSEKIHRLRVNPALWLRCESAITSERARPASQPNRPDSIVAPTDRRTPRSRLATNAMARTPTRTMMIVGAQPPK